jgi:hypothetical protein
MFVGLGLTMAAAELWAVLYWPGVLSVYLGIILVWRHLWEDNGTFSDRLPLLRKLAASAFVLTFLLIWTTKVVAVSAPLESLATATLGNYPSGTAVGGVIWDSVMDEDGRLNLKNPTGNSYRDIDLYVLSDIWVTGAIKLSGIDDVKFTPYDPGIVQIRGTWLGGLGPSGDPFQMPGPGQPVNLGHPTGIRIVGDVLHARSDIDILLVMIAFNRADGLRMPKRMFSRKKMPQFVKLRGTYKVLGRTVMIDRNVSIDTQRQ